MEFLDDSCVQIKSTIENNTLKFNFDQAFNTNTNQIEIYQAAAQPIVDAVLDGFNGTIFAYGQTSSGKTFTMQGILDNPELEGIIPRIIKTIYNIADKNSHFIKYIIKASMVEIYNEKIKVLIFCY